MFDVAEEFMCVRTGGHLVTSILFGAVIKLFPLYRRIPLHLLLCLPAIS